MWEGDGAEGHGGDEARRCASRGGGEEVGGGERKDEGKHIPGQALASERLHESKPMAIGDTELFPCLRGILTVRGHGYGC